MMLFKNIRLVMGVPLVNKGDTALCSLYDLIICPVRFNKFSHDNHSMFFSYFSDIFMID